MGRRPAWRDEDLPLFAELNADREVTEHLLGPLTRSRATHITEHFLREGFGFWAVEVPGVAGFIGMAGIGILSYTAPFAPCVEVGWRLGRRYWGQGFATEAARGVLEFRLRTVDLPEIVALTVPRNARPRAVMARLGMTQPPPTTSTIRSFQMVTS